jgi:hypothetical protein
MAEEQKHAGGRPIEYKPEVVEKVKAYLKDCQDEEIQRIKSDGEKSTSYEYRTKVKIPTIEGLANVLEIHKDTIYEWEKIYPEFSDVIIKLRQEQANRLILGGLSGTYNPIISKVLLTKHGYREGLDTTTNDKDLPMPIYGGKSKGV